MSRCCQPTLGCRTCLETEGQGSGEAAKGPQWRLTENGLFPKKLVWHPLPLHLQGNRGKPEERVTGTVSREADRRRGQCQQLARGPVLDAPVLPIHHSAIGGAVRERSAD